MIASRNSIASLGKVLRPPSDRKTASAPDHEVGSYSTGSKDTKLQYSTINARSEEFTTKPAFKDAWKRGQRCLCMMTNFYEWKKLDEKDKDRENDWAKWLGEKPASNEELLALLKPCSDEWLEIFPVDKKVGNVRNKDADWVCL